MKIIEQYYDLLSDIKHTKQLEKVEILVAKLALKCLDGIENETITAKEADKIFTELLLSNDKFKHSDKFYELLDECNLFHDWGTEFGPDINKIKAIAKRIIDNWKQGN